jgi:hypothetical protein
LPTIGAASVDDALNVAMQVVANVIEMKSDIFKLCYVTRRPVPTRASNIGIWNSVLRIMVCPRPSHFLS